MTYLFAASGILPALLAMWYFDRLDRARPEPPSALRRVAIAGGVATIPCILLELVLMKVGPAPGTLQFAAYHGFVTAALVEELAKVLCVRWFVWRRPEFDERLDGIVYATRAGLGFALVENVLYLLQPQSAAGFAVMFVARAVLTVPMHAISAGMMGYFAARRRFDGEGPGLLGGFAIAVLLHGAFDAAIFSMPAVVGHGVLPVLALGAIPLLIVVQGGLVLRRMARRALAADDAAEGRVAARAA